MQIDALQMKALTRDYFFGRVATFIRQQTTHDGYRDAVSDVPERNALWAEHWPALADEPEGLAAMYLCFVLACRTLGLDPGQGVAIARSAPDPAFSMKTFFSTRGLLRFSAFDVPELLQEDAR
jgi:hypothetical protein